jgi:hypothetical protein
VQGSSACKARNARPSDHTGHEGAEIWLRADPAIRADINGCGFQEAPAAA